MLTFLLLLGSVICEVFGQIAFKLGLSRGPEHADAGARGFFRDLAGSPWIGVGVGAYAVEFVLWFAALALAPLSVAMAFAALSYGGVVLASRWFLHEDVGWREWGATATITVGVAMVCWQPLYYR
ncbi:MAG: transporter [Proteobacteria bacterium]|nr:transporter [Pseudomonadota bacterium]